MILTKYTHFSMPAAKRKRSACAGILGVLAGLFIGGRAIKTYDWRTEWRIPAPLPIAYRAMTSREAVRVWWPDMELVDDGDNGGDELRVGSEVSFKVHQAPEVARIAPPFRIRCVYTDVESERRLREIVTGDLSGVLETLFDEGGGGTRIVFNWYARVTNPLLNLLGYAAEDAVMGSGERGLAMYCRRTVSGE